MKRCLIPLLVLLSSVAFSQVPVNDKGVATYTKTVQTDLSKKQLYTNAIGWLATTFGDLKNLVQQDDTVAGKIVMPRVELVKKIKGDYTRLRFEMSIDYKNSKWRYTITNIYTTINISDRFDQGYIVNGDINTEIEHLKTDIPKRTKKAEIERGNDVLKAYEQEVFDLNLIFSTLEKSLEEMMAIKDDF